MKNAMDIPHKHEIISGLLQIETSIKQIFLFGSRARKDNANPFSDIDIGIVAENKLNFYQLARLNEVMDKLDTLYTIEVVDFTNRKDDFSKEAMETREVLHENE
jgi:predicted nucleotidyltransferase